MTHTLTARSIAMSGWAYRCVIGELRKQRRRETGEFGARPDATLAEPREQLGVQCALSAICVALQKPS